MNCYILNHAGATSEIFAANDIEAISQAEMILGDVVVADQWDSDGRNDDGEPCRRLLIWADDESAQHDDGSHAIASLSTVGRA